MIRLRLPVKYCAVFVLAGCLPGDSALTEQASRNECALRFRAAQSVRDSIAVIDQRWICRAYLKPSPERP